MSRRLILVVVLFFIGAATLLAHSFGLLLLPFDVETDNTAKVATAPPKGATANAPASSPAAGAQTPAAALADATLDISRISPTGSSVFAGHAEPNSYVTVYENETAVGSVKADENGEWSLVTEHRFASLDPKLAFKATAEPTPQAQAPALAKGGDGKALATATSPEAVAKELVSDFEKLVAEAREEARANQGKPPASVSGTSSSASTPAQPVPPTATQPSKDSTVAEVREPKASSETSRHSDAAGGAQVAASGAGAPLRPVPAPNSTSVPVPIMFIYNEATFTDEGRRAVDLLLEYVKLKHLDSISLSGHADERGSEDYNMDLSRERLDAVASYLRGGGFSGKLDLVAKGKSEPFAGIDRSRFSGEALYQLDRRVELHLVR